MKIFSYILIFMIGHIAFAQDQFIKTDSPECYPEKVNAYINSLKKGQSPGYSLVIFTHDSIIYQNHHGLYDVENSSNKINIKTPFYIASVTKSFTAVAILKLMEKGELNLSDKVVDHLKYLPAYTNEITITNLLNHSSGLPEYSDKEDWRNNIYNNNDVVDLIKANNKVSFTPGTDFKYNNTGYVLLAEIIEEIACMPYEDYIKQEFISPLDLKNTFFPVDEQNCEGRAIGYSINENGDYEVFDTNGYHVIGSTGMYSSAEDLMKWIKAFDSNEILSKNMKELIFNYPVLPSGKNGYMNMGWFNETLGSHAKNLEGFEQNGLIGVNAGFRSYIIKAKNHDFNYIMLSNTGALPFEIIGKDLISCYFKRKD